MLAALVTFYQRVVFMFSMLRRLAAPFADADHNEAFEISTFSILNTLMSCLRSIEDAGHAIIS